MLRIGFALITVQLLAIIGLLLAGPLALLVRCAPLFGAFRRQMAELLSRADLRGFNPLLE